MGLSARDVVSPSVAFGFWRNGRWKCWPPWPYQTQTGLPHVAQSPLTRSLELAQAVGTITSPKGTKIAFESKNSFLAK